MGDLNRDILNTQANLFEARTKPRSNAWPR